MSNKKVDITHFYMLSFQLVDYRSAIPFSISRGCYHFTFNKENESSANESHFHNFICSIKALQHISKREFENENIQCQLKWSCLV